MKIETSIGGADWPGVGDLALTIERLGFDRITQPEVNRDPFLPLALAAQRTEQIELATSVAIAFPRSPTVIAYTARGVNDLSNGRFVLGLGTQVKGHIERRFATGWSSPGPRLRDYVAAVRAVWRAWDSGEPLRHEGEFYPLSLMTPAFSPGPSQLREVPIQIAGVNRYNLELAGEVCQGLRVHPFATRRYMDDVIWPCVKSGATRGQRELNEFEMIGGGFIATGKSDREVHAARERARYRIAFYGSTRTYLPVLEAHGWGDLNDKLRRLVADSKWDELATVVPDDVLDEFCVSGTYGEILPLIRKRYEHVVDTLSIDLPADPYEAEFADLLEGIRRLDPANADARQSGP